MTKAKPAPVAAQARTFIAVVLDRSGSMEAIRGDAIGGFNAFLADQKALPGAATLLLAQFDDEYEVVYDALPIADVRELTQKTFVPRGSTALFDALGRTLNDVAARLSRLSPEQKPARVIVVVITDGEENASREFTLPMVKKMIEERRREAWEILFLGTSEQAIEQACAVGIDRRSTGLFTRTPAGTRDVFQRVSRSIGASRTTGRPPTLDPDAKKKMN
jgi:Mg-chelatase subunit ChlD